MSARTTRRLNIAVLAAVAALGLAACGESPQVTVYEQGRYQGKADTRPWEGPSFNGDREAWEKALKNRGRNQSEYNRIE
ncbi:hypothetical protein [Thauera aromatica]|uniref:hypothetical protein n=1 Tax=Thauera aromatica TaxID=59405 RepID=UPI001FFC3938|nr:hypothetical protein [Thauera aromatica]MCK2096486.1 hypothetical protein [Thauera aromatica]